MISTDLTIPVNNDTTFTIALTYNYYPLDVTDYTVKAYLKASPSTPDSSATQFTLTKTSGVIGGCTWVLPHADVTAAGNQWYRIDVIDGSGNVSSCISGNLTVQAA